MRWLLFLAALAAFAQEQPEAAIFRTGVTHVRLDAQVSEGNRLVTGLTKEDFVILDNGQPQPIAHFGQESVPVSLLLLLDVSGSMKKFLDQMAATARQALQYLTIGDRVGVMLFSKNTKVTREFTGDLVDVARAIKDAAWDDDLESGTAINAAVVDAAAAIMKYEETKPLVRRGPDRRAILIVTDNLALNFQSPDEQAIRALYDADTVLNAIVVGKGERPDRSRPSRNPDFTPADVFRIAEETGGEAIKAEHAGNSFRHMTERIRTRYSIQYRAPEARAGSFRRIQVDLAPEARKRYPQAVVRARGGYYVR